LSTSRMYVKPRRKRRGSGEPVKRAVVDLLRLKRWGERWGCGKPIITMQRIHGCLPMGCFVGSAAMVEPPGKPGGRDKP